MARPPSDPVRDFAPLIAIDEALARVLAAVTPVASEAVAIDDARGRVLAADVVATGDVPPFPCSAMDGYALAAGPAGRTLRVAGESRAGAPSGLALADGQAIRVSTGAAIPSGATAVIPQEDVDAAQDGTIVTCAQSPDGAHIRGAGEDIESGTVVLAAGRALAPIELGAAVAAGAGTVTVARRPRVAVLCTGDELRAPGEPLGPGEIHNSNAPMLTGLATQAGAVTGPAGRLVDDRAATVDAIAAAIERSEMVILSGGVSVGPHDHVKPALAAIGVDQRFWGVALQPGKPTWFGVAPDGTLVFGLPGNPVSAVVTFSLFVAPALAAMQGAPPPVAPHSSAVLAGALARKPRREQAVRVALADSPSGPVATPTGAQASHILTSLLEADALAIVPIGDGAVAAGERVALRALAR